MRETTMDEVVSMSELMADNPIAFFRATAVLVEQEDKEDKLGLGLDD